MSATKLQGASLFFFICRDLQALCWDRKRGPERATHERVEAMLPDRSEPQSFVAIHGLRAPGEGAPALPPLPGALPVAGKFKTTPAKPAPLNPAREASIPCVAAVRPAPPPRAR